MKAVPGIKRFQQTYRNSTIKDDDARECWICAIKSLPGSKRFHQTRWSRTSLMQAEQMNAQWQLYLLQLFSFGTKRYIKIVAATLDFRTARQSHVCSSGHPQSATCLPAFAPWRSSSMSATSWSMSAPTSATSWCKRSTALCNSAVLRCSDSVRRRQSFSASARIFLVGPHTFFLSMVTRTRQPLPCWDTEGAGKAQRAPRRSRAWTSLKRSMDTAAASSNCCLSSFAAASVVRVGPLNVVSPFLRRAHTPLAVFSKDISFYNLWSSNFSPRRPKTAGSDRYVRSSYLCVIRSMIYSLLIQSAGFWMHTKCEYTTHKLLTPFESCSQNSTRRIDTLWAGQEWVIFIWGHCLPSIAASKAF